MVHNNMSILYGGFEGTDKKICENTKSLGEFFLKKLQEHGDHILLSEAKSGKQLNSNEIRSHVIRLAKIFQSKLDIKSGSVISICSENRIEFCLTTIAAFLLGAIVTPLNISYTECELTHAVNLSKPKLLFVSVTNYQKCLKLKQQNSFIDKLIIYDETIFEIKHSILMKDAMSFNELLQTKASDLNNFQCQAQNMKEHVALIQNSSGTTGLPKGAQITQFNLLVANTQFKERDAKLEGPIGYGRVILGYLPLFHGYGMLLSIISIIQGSNLVLLPRFVEEDFLRTIEIYKVTTIFAVPPTMILLAKSSFVDKFNLRSLRTIICGAAPLGKEIETDVKKRIGLKNVRQGYGMTEGTFAFLIQDDNHTTNGSVGVLLKGSYGRVVDKESGKALGPNQRGEMCFKGNSIMKGYVGNRQATSATIDSDGWLHTGDVGYYNDNGEWFVVDRMKELIKYKGFQVPPAELEAVLLTHPDVEDVGVIGIPDSLCGELPFAFVVQRMNSSVNEQDIIRFVSGKVSSPKWLRGGVKFIHVIPKGPTGKILRRKLREMAEKLKSKL